MVSELDEIERQKKLLARKQAAKQGHRGQIRYRALVQNPRNYTEAEEYEQTKQEVLALLRVELATMEYQASMPKYHGIVTDALKLQKPYVAKYLLKQKLMQ